VTVFTVQGGDIAVIFPEKPALVTEMTLIGQWA
jgi:hypothetical protein